MSSQPGRNPNPNAVLIVGALLAVVTLAAYLFAEMEKLQTGPMLAIMGPVLAGLLIADRLDRLKTSQADKLEDVAQVARKVEHQTNGALASTVRAITAEVVSEQFRARDAAKAEAHAARTAQAVMSPAPPTAPGPPE